MPQQQPLLLQKSDEVMRRRGLELARVELLGQVEEGLGLVPEEVDGEDGLEIDN